MAIELTILGSGSATPTLTRNPTAQFLQIDGKCLLIDCGEGTQMQLMKFQLKSSKIDTILISHLHGDHYFGLIGLLTSMSLLSRTQDLHLYGPPILQDIITLQLNAGMVTLSYNLHFHPLTDEGLIAETNKIEVFSFKVQHRIDCWGFLFKEKKNPTVPKIDLDIFFCFQNIKTINNFIWKIN